MSVSAQKMLDSDKFPENNHYEDREPQPRKILLVDEQAHVLRVIRVNLERCGYQVDTALSAELALQQVQKKGYDAVVMTSDLVDMTVRQLCERANELLVNRRLLHHGAPVPIMLVGCEEADSSWVTNMAKTESISRPVSLKWIVFRLSEMLGEPEYSRFVNAND